ncbi:MAG TPA: SusC/RagA family TonB-linked outer membrane protein [Gemmatimonadaceae bacterium]|jgi:TonB-linked SusC/RagA family outer membrane protein|nr:SusC/RagA family TonB-linked outer membrane protein [Gemmatimonadaceae bacterium]
MRRQLLSFVTAFAFSASAAFAQSGTTVTGRVTSDVGAPLGGASVFLAGTNIGATTNDDGSYTFIVPSSRANGGTATLTARVIGYTARSVQIALTPGSSISQNFTLPVNPFHLGEVVVTGAGTTTTRERLGVTINRVDSSTLRRANEPQNVIAALAAKAPNVNVRTQSGEPGAAASVVIRGEASLTGTNQPLFVVDGQPIDNQTVSPATMAIGVGSGAVTDRQGGTVTTNRAADVNPSDIESIEILKGSAAAAIYGARAANGVVLITTKRGRSGPTRISIGSTLSWDKPRLVDFLQHDYAQGSLARGAGPIPDAAATCGDTPDCAPTAGRTSWGAKLPAGTTTYDHLGELFKTGLTADNNIQLSGGNDRTTFYSSVGLTNQDGIIEGPNNKYNRASFRLKGTQEVSSKLTLGGNFNYVDARGNFVQRGNDVSGLLLGALRTPPAFNNLPYLNQFGQQRSYRFPNATTVESFGCCAYYDNPFFVASSNGNRDEVGRAISNFNVEWRPLTWLNVKETIGGDYYTDSRLQALPLTSANDGAGNVIRSDQNNLIIDHNLLASATFDRGGNFNTTFTVGQNLNSRRYRQHTTVGEGLIAPTPLALENTISQAGIENKSLRHIESYFGQGEFNFYNQLYLTAGLRNDGFSTFGASQRRHTFKKASAAWTFSNLLHGSEQTGLLSFGKLRAAYGETGREPDVYAALNALSTVVQFGSAYGDVLRTTIGGVPGVTSSLRLGNPALRPELQKEFEVGADLGFLDQKVDLSVVGYNKKSSDVILPITVNAAATGFTSAFQNTAALSNKGIEVSFNARPYTSQNLAWELGVQFGRNRGKVTDLGGAEIFDLLEGFGANEAEGADVIGYAPGVIIGTGFVHCGTGAQIAVPGMGNAAQDIDALCAATPGGYKKNALFLGPNGLPVADPAIKVLGDPHPKYTMSYTTSLKLLNRFTLSGLLDVKKGGTQYNGTRGALYVFGTHKDTDQRSGTGQYGVSWDTKTYPDVAGPGKGVVGLNNERDWENWLSIVGTGGGFTGPGEQFMEDAGWVKLRELSLSFNVDKPFLKNLTGFSSADIRISGRNLKTWTQYRGLDPEVNNAGAEYLTQGLDWFANPQSRSFVLSFSLNR